MVGTGELQADLQASRRAMEESKFPPGLALKLTVRKAASADKKDKLETRINGRRRGRSIVLWSLPIFWSVGRR